MKRAIYILLLSCLMLFNGKTSEMKANNVGDNITYTKNDSIVITKVLRESEKLRNTDRNTILFFANKFLGRKYVAHTLEVNNDERLVVNTRQLDCTTFIETVTALTICHQKKYSSFEDYCKVLEQLRYRDGKRNGYTSRLHYFSDWIKNKASMGLVTEIQAPNPPFCSVQTVNVNYMTTHAKAYKALKANPSLIPDIAKQEKGINGIKARFIPKSQIKNTKIMRQAIHDGDIIAITCSKPGLDIAHLGFAVWKKDGLHLLNASQLHKKVVLEPMILKTYLSKHPSHTGIRIIRINK